ncbi:MAG: M23 family metallopeptidase [Chitinophagaceae bacterium]|nr:M23 family metallopeptidase [Chitinophagaceae bacterium]MCB9046964.1 M23 family metallopeptidase [Chitinophagales bacterium]
MKRVRKYYYNTDTHRFEKLELSWKTRLLRIGGFVSAALVTATIIVAIAFQFLDSPKEKQLKDEMQVLRQGYTDLRNELDDINKSLTHLEHRDNNIYRAVFEAAPLPDSVRLGKDYSNTDPLMYAYANPNELISSMQDAIGHMRKRLELQANSYDTLQKLVETKERMLASIPAIQPVSNRTLDRVASGFGYRIDPIYKTPKMHTGIDFTAATGTPIYATGDGVVKESGYDNGGYGNNVVISHGYGYSSLYGHMKKVKVRTGDRVRRGEVIGWVGSTGKSTGPHVHYEIIKNGEKIDPIHFFFNDLSASEYERLTKIAAASNQSFD